MNIFEQGFLAAALVATILLSRMMGTWWQISPWLVSVPIVVVVVCLLMLPMVEKRPVALRSMPYMALIAIVAAFIAYTAKIVDNYMHVGILPLVCALGFVAILSLIVVVWRTHD